MENEVDINVDIKEIILLENIGQGAFSDVYSAKCPTKFADKIIAVKKLRNSQDSSKNLERELIILSRLKHPNIVTLYGISKDEVNRFHILLEYSECGSLYNFLHVKKNSVSDKNKLYWMLQCAKGIEYLHDQNIVHRDLKTANLLLYDEFQTLKLCDFGTVREIASNNTANTGTANYMAPEVMVSGKYDTKCDVYSFGIIFWEVLSRKKPFYHLGNITPLTLQNKVAKGVHPPLSDIQGLENLDGIKELIERCWHTESKERPTIQQVLQQLESSYGYIEFEKKICTVENSNDSMEGEDLIFEANWQDIILKQAIGSGRLTKVYKADWRAVDGEKTIAVKTYKYLKNEGQYFERKLKYISRISHDNIIRLYGISQDNNNRFALLMEYADCGSLYNVLHGNEGSMDYSFIEALNWMHQCVKAMAYLHDRGIIHCHLKPTTMFFVNDFQRLKICSSSYMNDEFTMMTSVAGTPQYMSPEEMNGGKNTEKSDVYSFGITLWEVMSRKKPYFSMDSHLRMAIEDVKGKRPDLNDVNIFTNSDSIKDLISKCWDSDPKKRPSMKDLIESIGNLLPST
ncbi:probable serine/threonine-protein kinase DDB_G0271682 isoform X1 [Drosophila innubila]|uniref:probable serine/threonine-protein kinase DDB_G0271682 isoform X1 n=1 Tax=Drosophila innubila TaxID=198719 RepID=UPI00148D13DE|nr:probable serine/threonine-protein kinase DDB_G0271682 isoform X1 [Drosophila innubila]